MDLLAQTPRARTTSLLVEEVDDESLLYDLDDHGAHCLNPAATLVWRACDGRTTVREIVSRLDEVGLPRDAPLVWMALSRLHAAGLVESVALPGPKASFSRKEVVRVLGAAAAMTLLFPAVDSMVAPLAAAAASCVTANACTKESNPCSGLPICGAPGQCCQAQGKKKCKAKGC